MSVNHKIFIAALFLCFSLASVGHTRAQEQTTDTPKLGDGQAQEQTTETPKLGDGQARKQTIVKPNFGDGALEEVSAEMAKLLQLKWNGKNLALDRDWDKDSEKKKKSEDQDDDDVNDAVEEMINRGLPVRQADRLAEKLAKNGPFLRARMGFKLAPKGLQKAFSTIAWKAGSNSSGASGSGDERRIRFGGQTLSGHAVITSDDLKFEFTEATKERSFEIAESRKGRFRFEFSYDDLFIRLLQSKTGKTQLIWITGDKAEVFVGDSFSNFRKRNPQVVDELLFPLFERLGIALPLSAPDP